MASHEIREILDSMSGSDRNLADMCFAAGHRKVLENAHCDVKSQLCRVRRCHASREPVAHGAGMRPCDPRDNLHRQAKPTRICERS